MKLLAAVLLALATRLPAQQFRLTPFAGGIVAPTDIQNAGDGSGRLFFVQQNGFVRVMASGGAALRTFLDISTRTRASDEQGLVGLAFSPKFAQNGRFFVEYTNLAGNTVISQFRVSSSNPDAGDATSETILMTIPQPFANHNGGQLRFGPDGYLYIALGDGGSTGDPLHNGQNLQTLLGKLLRVDVESSPGSVVIPPDNPFVKNSNARPEIWAYGLRNPWRFSFDRATNDLWIGDVGQDNFEEVDFQPASSHGGENYGWSIAEGDHCVRAGCSFDGLTMPVAEYSHTLGCSVTGGFVYRGVGSPGLRGTYLYADFCTGIIWGVALEGGEWVVRRLLTVNGAEFTTFGQDESGELYLAEAGGGTIYKITGPPAPRILNNGVVNSASFAPGLAPGSLATVFAPGVLDTPGVVQATQIPLLATLNGVTVTVNGTGVPLYAVANVNGVEQVNFQVPFNLAGTSSASVVVSRAGASSTPVTVRVLDVQPAVYTVDGKQAVVVHNQDYTLATAGKPLAKGEFAFIYAAGLGRVANQPPTGAAAPVLPPLATASGDVKVTLGGISCEIQYAGLAPGLVGVYQVNFRVPDGAPVGSDDLVVSVGSTASPTVKVPVQ